MYFLVEGRVNLVFGENDLVFKYLQRGAYFGDIEVIQQIPRKYTVKAVEDLELLVLNRNLWNIIQNDFLSVA